MGDDTKIRQFVLATVRNYATEEAASKIAAQFRADEIPAVTLQTIAEGVGWGPLKVKPDEKTRKVLEQVAVLLAERLSPADAVATSVPKGIEAQPVIRLNFLAGFLDLPTPPSKKGLSYFDFSTSAWSTQPNGTGTEIALNSIQMKRLMRSVKDWSKFEGTPEHDIVLGRIREHLDVFEPTPNQAAAEALESWMHASFNFRTGGNLNRIPCEQLPQSARKLFDEFVKEPNPDAAPPVAYCANFAGQQVFVVHQPVTDDYGAKVVAFDNRGSTILEAHAVSNENGAWHFKPVPETFFRAKIADKEP